MNFKYLDLKIQKLLRDLDRLEHIWFELLIPEIGKVEELAESLAEREFERTYSYEQAELDPNYDAKRILDRDMAYYAEEHNLSLASRTTIYALFIATGQLLEQALIEIVSFVEEDDGELGFENINVLIDRLKSPTCGIDVKSLATWCEIENIRTIANYFKHGKHPRHLKSGNYSVSVTPRPDAKELAWLASKSYRSHIPNTPLLNPVLAISEQELRMVLQTIRAFLNEISEKYSEKN